MADWYVVFYDRSTGNWQGEYSVMNPDIEIRNSEPGGFSGELALGQQRRNTPAFGITRDEFIPYETHYEIWRQSTGSGTCISGGMLTSVNLNFNRDSILISGKDWLHYLQRRIYPFSPEDYVTFNSDAKHSYWDKWPKKWGMQSNAVQVLRKVPVDISEIIRDLLLSIRTGIPIDQYSTAADRGAAADPYALPLVWNLQPTGSLVTYDIKPGDSRSIYDHINYFAELKDGFEFDIEPRSLQFKMWSPSKWVNDNPVYVFQPSANVESAGAITEFDWTNEGPEGTYLIGLGSGRHKVGATWTTDVNQSAAGRLDKVYDYGEVRDGDVILNKLKDQNDLWNQKKLSLGLLNPEFLVPSFYAAGRPRDLLGATVQTVHGFSPYHTVNALFTIQAIKWNVDNSGNENVALELMMIYEPETGLSGGRSEELG